MRGSDASTGSGDTSAILVHHEIPVLFLELTSFFDCEAGGQQIWGQATENLPQYTLRVDDKGDIYAEGLDELLYGRLSNVL